MTELADVALCGRCRRIVRGVLLLLGCGAIAPASAQMRPLLLEEVTAVDGTDKPPNMAPRVP